ncbi:hypothetical protein EGR_07743 [Echinococcus granulosus]|uniref:Uncharacterized protein n=1 Tax=Echinococcus granulosus TaxID=6210 RepID=W6UVF6_ECHGR|nr:hypothetical protein EGR_07743 [Echinococcus granulosus]EUB57419.1 hypothetical protein EGR_07743 [Echinococcus granulosus]
MQNNKLDNALRQLCNTLQFGPFHKTEVVLNYWGKYERLLLINEVQGVRHWPEVSRKKVGLVFPKSLVPVAFAQNSSNFEGISSQFPNMINLPVSFKLKPYFAWVIHTTPLPIAKFHKKAILSIRTVNLTVYYFGTHKTLWGLQYDLGIWTELVSGFYLNIKTGV